MSSLGDRLQRGDGGDRITRTAMQGGEFEPEIGVVAAVERTLEYISSSFDSSIVAQGPGSLT
jgi:hypothetical protein